MRRWIAAKEAAFSEAPPSAFSCLSERQTAATLLSASSRSLLLSLSLSLSLAQQRTYLRSSRDDRVQACGPGQ